MKALLCCTELVLLILSNTAYAFTSLNPVVIRPSVALAQNRKRSSQLFTNNTNNESNDKELSKATRRAGGRVRSKRPVKDLGKKSPLTVPGWVKTIAVPFVALWILSQVLFGGGGSTSDNYYYYQSSVYQSSVYGSDGRVDTSRKESVRSNIPGLVDGKSQQRRLPSNDNDVFDYESSADDEFDRMLDQEIDSMMRGFFKEFW